jgi:hypothetical protein
MQRRQYYELPEFSAILSFIDSIFHEINMGMMIYHLEDIDDPGTLRLLYANKEASRCTGADLQPLIGRYIHDAFPSLEGTEIPQAFRDVVVAGQSRRIGMLDYEDTKLERKKYRIKAFPMPSQCVGILFEGIAE